jgi:hypothetical protein
MVIYNSFITIILISYNHTYYSVSIPFSRCIHLCSTVAYLFYVAMADAVRCPDPSSKELYTVTKRIRGVRINFEPKQVRMID